MKNASRKRFLVCFRPVVDMDLMLESKAVVVDRVQSSVKNKEDIVVKPSDGENSIVIHHPGKKTFSQVIKAVVFEIILAKKIRDRKVIDQGICSPEKHRFRLKNPDRLMSTHLGESVNRVLVDKEIQKTISMSNTISSCSSSSSSLSSQNSTQKPKGQELQNNKTTCRQQRIDRSSSSDSAIFLLLASLAVTIFWGKFLAILFTSVWLYFLPQYQKPSTTRTLESIDRSLEMKTENCKKKVIMEGLLERNPQKRRGIKALT